MSGVLFPYVLSIHASPNLWYKAHLSRQYIFWSLRCSWSLSALLQLHLHSPINTWLQWIGQRQLQDETRNVWALVFGATYTGGLTVCNANRPDHCWFKRAILHRDGGRLLQYSVIDAGAQWPLFCRRHFKTYFPPWKLLYANSNLITKGRITKTSAIAQTGNGLGPAQC